MKSVFADAFFYFALLNPADDRHERATEYTRIFAGKIVTTAWIMLEVRDGLAGTANRSLFIELLSQLQTDPDVLILPPDDKSFESGLALYIRRPDKHWSLTDCISFSVMERLGITEAPTGDRHFEQAGFVPLLI